MKILTGPHPFLRHKAQPVTTVTKSLRHQIDQMVTLLQNTKDPEGVGLAATQVGLDKRLFILLLDKTPHVFINPIVLSTSKEMFSAHYPKKNRRWLEGCLSLPRLWGFVDRPHSITLSYQTLDLKDPKLVLKPVTKEFSDLESAYVQHERDHLDGILFTDHLLKQRGQLYQEIDHELEPIELPRL